MQIKSCSAQGVIVKIILFQTINIYILKNIYIHTHTHTPLNESNTYFIFGQHGLQQSLAPCFYAVAKPP